MFYPFGLGNFDILGGGEGGYVTKEEAQQMINDSLITAKESGAFDDTKVYDTYQDMISSEPVGREDTLYIITTDDENHGTRYIWTDDGYVPIEDSITGAEISDIVV